MRKSWRRVLGISTLLVAAILASSCATPIEPVIGYTCCNLRADAGWISSNNVQYGALIPAGEAVKLTTVKRRFYVYGTIGDLGIGLRDDSAKTEQDTLRWVRRIVVAEDPRRQLASWPADVRSAVASARVVVGMTRAQVAMALGHPSPNDTPDPAAADSWRYWVAIEDEPVDLRFGRDGRVVEISGKASAVKRIELQR